MVAGCSMLISVTLDTGNQLTSNILLSSLCLFFNFFAPFPWFILVFIHISFFAASLTTSSYFSPSTSSPPVLRVQRLSSCVTTRSPLRKHTALLIDAPLPQHKDPVTDCHRQLKAASGRKRGREGEGERESLLQSTRLNC